MFFSASNLRAANSFQEAEAFFMSGMISRNVNRSSVITNTHFFGGQ